MRVTNGPAPVKGPGVAPIIIWCRFIGLNGANPTLTHGMGISVVRTNEGIWTGTIDAEFKPVAWTIFVNHIENDTANFHELVVTDISESAGTFVIRHRFDDNTAYAAPVADDVIDGISVLVVGTMY